MQKIDASIIFRYMDYNLPEYITTFFDKVANEIGVKAEPGMSVERLVQICNNKNAYAGILMAATLMSLTTEICDEFFAVVPDEMKSEFRKILFLLAKRQVDAFDIGGINAMIQERDHWDAPKYEDIMKIIKQDNKKVYIKDIKLYYNIRKLYMNQYDTIYLYISTLFFILLMYVHKIVMMQPFSSSEILMFGLLYFIWFYLTKYIVNYLAKPIAMENI